MNDFEFSGKVVLAIGGSSGIGNGIARAFKDRGAVVYVWGTRASADEYTEEGSNLEGLSYSCVDVSDRSIIDTASEPSGGLDVLVLCQGTVIYGRGEYERPGWDRVMAVNLDSVMTCAMKFREKLKASGGSIIVVSSTSGFQAARGNPAYSASKAGAIGLTRTLGEAWAPEGIRVNGIAPGLVDTKLTKITIADPDRRAAVIRGIPARRLGMPTDMAGAALFLASPLSSYIVGQTLVVDGGLTLSSL